MSFCVSLLNLCGFSQSLFVSTDAVPAEVFKLFGALQFHEGGLTKQLVSCSFYLSLSLLSKSHFGVTYQIESHRFSIKWLQNVILMRNMKKNLQRKLFIFVIDGNFWYNPGTHTKTKEQREKKREISFLFLMKNVLRSKEKHGTILD